MESLTRKAKKNNIFQKDSQNTVEKQSEKRKQINSQLSKIYFLCNKMSEKKFPQSLSALLVLPPKGKNSLQLKGFMKVSLALITP